MQEFDYNKIARARVIDEEKFLEMRNKNSKNWLHLHLNSNGGAYLEFAERQFRIVELAISEVKDKKLKFYLKGLDMITKNDVCETITTDLIHSDIFILREETVQPCSSRLDLYAHSGKEKVYLYSSEPVTDLFDYLHIYAKVENVTGKEIQDYFYFITVVSNERVGEFPDVAINFSKKPDPEKMCRLFYKMIKNECKVAVMVNQNYALADEKNASGSEEM